METVSKFKTRWYTPLYHDQWSTNYRYPNWGFYWCACLRTSHTWEPLIHKITDDISSSGLWSFPFCANCWRTYQRACCTTRCVICYSLHVANKLLNKRAASCVSEVTELVMCAVSCPSGPFVMTTEEEIRQTISDYQTCRNGFERAGNWRSKIRDSLWTPHSFPCWKCLPSLPL